MPTFVSERSYAVDAFLSLRLTHVDASLVFSMYPSLLTSDPSADLVPVFGFLLSTAEIPFPDLRKTTGRCPLLLVASVPTSSSPLSTSSAASASSAATASLVAPPSSSPASRTLIPEIQCFCALGISHRETSSVVLRSPGLFTFSIKNNFKPKVEVLLHEMGRYFSELKELPQCFSFILERKIKPRHLSLKENRVWMLLCEILKVSDGRVHDSVNGDAIFCWRRIVTYHHPSNA